jgi:hypothetical protein
MYQRRPGAATGLLSAGDWTLGAAAAARRLVFPFLFHDRGGLLVCGPP